MTPTLSRGAQAYRQTHVQSRSPLELVVMLYDGAIRFLEQAGDAMAARDMATKARAMSKAMAIVSELQSTLNLAEGGEVAAQLDALYVHINGKLLEANVQRERAPIDEAVALLRPLRDAWTQIATSPATAA